ncbi:MAG: hypothetical protein KKA42_16205 [candidate division Zixibacteria bacterium]|nr:hypothetical protein [candidate division Zixibacteria bacterium]
MYIEPLQDYGFFIVKRFARMYEEFANNPKNTLDVYALPPFNSTPDRVNVWYHGLDRDYPMSYPADDLNTPASVTAAMIRMGELEEVDRCWNSLIYAEGDLLDVLGWAEQDDPGLWEPVWVRPSGTKYRAPGGYLSLGHEPSDFPLGFSPIADALCFPLWHGTDLEGTAFLRFFKLLNRFALFDNPGDACDFLRHYLSFRWTERSDWTIIEVFGRKEDIQPVLQRNR